MRAMRAVIRARSAQPVYGSPSGGPDLVENDYYRLLRQPRD